jgi:tellurite resistance protein TerC
VLDTLAREGLVLAAEGGQAAPATPAWAWGGFLAFIAVALFIDLKVVMQESHKVTTREAVVYSAVWIALGVAFTGVIWAWQGGGAAGEYITGYLIEKSLSLDNVFVWAVIFSFFAVPEEHRHRVLFWGVFGALALRAAFIFGGVALLESLEAVVYVFGVLLLYTAYRIATTDEVGGHPENNRVLVRVQRFIPQTEEYRGAHFFVRENGRRLATPLFTVLLAIEFTDVIFAVDSVPAILAITRNEFLVFSSNAFAILGLRALYFLLADAQDRFVYLDKGLGIVLAFVGVKFLIAEFVEIPVAVSLGVIGVVLAATTLLSLRAAPKQAKREPDSDERDGDSDEPSASGDDEKPGQGEPEGSQERGGP